MNWKRGLFRFWLVATVIWIAGCFWLFNFEQIHLLRVIECFRREFGGPVPSNPNLWCRLMYDFGEAVVAGGLALGVPVAALGIGMATIWALKGFRRAG